MEGFVGNRLYVGNLPFTSTEDDLRNVFASLGTVSYAKVVMDRETGRSRGFGFVEVDGMSRDVGDLTDLTLGGRTLKVNIAQDKKPQQDRRY